MKRRNSIKLIGLILAGTTGRYLYPNEVYDVTARIIGPASVLFKLDSIERIEVFYNGQRKVIYPDELFDSL